MAQDKGFRKVPDEARIESKQKRDQILKANGLGPHKSKILEDQSDQPAQEVAKPAVVVSGVQLSIDEKLVGLKAAAVNARFGQLNLPPRTFMRGCEQNKWIEKHKFGELRMQRDTTHRENEEVNRKNIQFAKDLFVSWDDDGSGILEAEEIIRPLISLGLAPNSNFAIMLLQALDPKPKKGRKELNEITITLQEFIKIFRSNKVSEALFNLITKESKKRLKNNLEPVPVSEMPTRRLEHPGVAQAAKNNKVNFESDSREGDVDSGA